MKNFFEPKSIALVGATEKAGSVGRAILENLLASKNIQIFPVNPQRQTIMGIRCYSDIVAITEKIDLAIVATPARTVPEITELCCKVGVGGIIIISAGFREAGKEGKKLEEKINAIRKKYGIRIIGPNCMGIIRPNSDFNASFLKTGLEKGKIAFISQSGALGSAVLSWAFDSHVGFSTFVSMGSMLDVDFGDMIDYLGTDPYTKSIIMYMEGVGNARKFMSAARGFARSKPIIIIKPGKYHESARAASSHTGSMAGDDEVYEAAFKRAGVVRVQDIADIFNVAEVLQSRNLPTGPRLAIVTNAGGPGVMATDMVMALKGELADLSAESLKKLDAVLPEYWSRSNPVDILGDADDARYAAAIKTCLEDKNVNGLIIIYTPQGAANPVGLARSITDLVKNANIPVITVFMGGMSSMEGRTIFLEHGIPSYATPEEAVKTYMYMYSYSRNLEMLYETPAELPLDQAPPKHHLKAFIQRAIKKGRNILTEEESKSFLRVYNIPLSETQVATHVEDAVTFASRMGYPVVIKISSPDITHKSDAKGVITGIENEEKLRAAFTEMINSIKEKMPEAEIEGISVEKMIEDIDYEVILGAKRDNDFGSVILFGMGGIYAELFRDFSIAIPPLNQTLARMLMSQTKAYELIQGYRGKSPVDMDRLEQIVVGFSNLIEDFPEILEVDINPLAISNGEIYALDARIVIDMEFVSAPTVYPHLVITPYPTRYINSWKMSDGTDVLLRPIRPEDEPLEREMLSTLSEEALRYRFFQVIKNISHEMLTRFCNIDYDREMAYVAEIKEKGGRKIIGIGRLIMEPDLKKGEFAVVVHDDYQRRGLGNKLVDLLIGLGQDKGLESIYGFVLTDNEGMLKICERFGFYCEINAEHTAYVTLDLR